MESAATTVALIICLALLPGSFVGAYFLMRTWVKKPVYLVLLTIVVGLVILCAGEAATVAGCAAIAPPNFK